LREAREGKLVERGERWTPGRNANVLRLLLTERMRLVAATAPLIRAEMEDRAELSERLRADVPAEWPPDEMLAEALSWFHSQLEENPGIAGWLAWYGIAGGDPDVLVASAGFTGPPAGGVVEVGYSVLPAFRRRGYGTEMVRALVDLALRAPGVRCVVADARRDNAPSVGLLCRLGFTEAGPGAEPGLVRFAKERGEQGCPNPTTWRS
jgi:RimJ/RimL family protein N-acetyltransferase